jgi:glycerol-3-phosphate dehydrogenase
VVLEDAIDGARFSVRPEVVVNAAGPWIDRTNRILGRETEFIGGTKGSHLVLDHPALRAAIGEHEFFFENDDGRIVLIFPFFDRVLVGTSDIRIADPDQAHCTEEEVDYFLAMLRRVFPGIAVDREAIVFTFSGVRPLPRPDRAATTGQISRDHTIETLPAGGDRPFPVFSLIGGKWTTFRAFSEEAADLALTALGRNRDVRTENLPIGGGLGYPENPFAQDAWAAAMAAGAGIPTHQAILLLQRYGTYAELPGTYMGFGPDRALSGDKAYSRREIEFLALKEKVVHLDDLLLRRTLLGVLGRLDRALVREVGGIAAEVLGWSGDHLAKELERVEALLRSRHRVDLI